MSVKGVVYLLLPWCLLLSEHQAAAQLFSHVFDPALNATAKATACAWGDFNNDGNLDLFLANSTDRPSIIFVGQGNGSFAFSTIPDPWAAQGGSWGDFDNDGHLDLARTLLGIGGGLFVHSNNGNGTFTAGRIAGLSHGPVWLDYDLDGNLDLSVLDSYGMDPGIYIFRREPDGRFYRLPMRLSHSTSHAGAWGDYDNDGDLDLLAANDGANCLYRNDQGTLQRVHDPTFAAHTREFTSCAWADFDNDGWLDAFMTSFGEGNLLFRNNGDGGFVKVEDSALAVVAQSTACAWGDYDNDGDLDIFVANTTNHPPRSGVPSFLFRNETPAQSWLKVKLEGRASNRTGIGARVRAFARIAGVERSLLREISGGNGSGQDAPLAHFGLGDAVNVSRLQIEWPSGHVQVLENVAADQSLAVIETRTLRIVTRPLAPALKFRVEPSPTYVTIPMLDTGTAGDEIAEDGIFTAIVPGQFAGVRAGFYIEATDLLGAVNTFPQEVFPAASYDRVFPTDALTRECIIRWGETDISGAFATYHLWLNLSNTARWSNRTPVLNDTPLDATFVYNNSRIIYNVRPAYHSSPWHRAQRTTGPDGHHAIDYGVNFPADNSFLGATEALWIHPGNLMSAPGNDSPIASSDTGAQAESAANTILKAFGLQGNYQRYVHVIVNGSRRSMNQNQPFIMQDAQRPNVEMMQQWSPGDRGGDLLWLEDWYEWFDNGDDFGANNDADLTRREVALHPSGKAFHMGAYRFMFRTADTRPGKSPNDYSTLFALLNAVTPTNDAPIRLSAIEPLLDYRQWMRMLAVQHACGNWDTYGYDRGRNAYMYRNSTKPVQLWAWKNNFTLGVGGHGATMDFFTSTDLRIMQMWREPTILRAYWEGFYDLINGPFRSAYMDPIIDARAAALSANGVLINQGMATSVKNYIRDRRNYIAGRLSFVTNTPLSAVTVSTNGNLLTLRGTAPIQVHHLFINGVSYPVSWLGVSNSFQPPTNWTAKVVLVPGQNNFTVAGYDANYALVTAIITVDAQYTGPAADPGENVMLTEIMYRPTQPGTEYVELFNKSPNLSFNLHDWKFDGLDFVFPSGSILGPNQFILLAADPYTLGATFPVTSHIFRYSGALDCLGETLSLLLPDHQGLVDRVRYESTLPWPQRAKGRGSALQVIDINEDNSRVSNWTDGFDWRYITYTGTIFGSADPIFRGTNFLLFLDGPGTVYIDDLVLVRGTVAEAGTNVIVNGDFELPLQGTWTTHGNHSGSRRSSAASHNGGASLQIVSSGIGADLNYVRQLIPGNSTSEVFTLSFWFLPSNEGSVLTTRTTPGSQFISSTGITPFVATPGQSNSFPTDLPPYDPIWLNEISVAESEPWIEFYNRGTNAVSLSNYWLADISGLGAQSLAEQPDVAPAEFRVIPLPGSPSPGSYALWRKVGTHKQIVDYFNFDSVLYGAVPDGQPFTRLDFRYPTKGLSNLSPRIKSIERYPGITYLTFEVYPGHRYYAEYKDALSDTSWSVLTGDFVATAPEHQIADTRPSTGQRFYRLSYINAVEW